MRQNENAPSNSSAFRLALVLGAALLIGAMLFLTPTPRAGAVGEPTITGLSPNGGSTSGGNQVMVSGTNFVYQGTTITFGGSPATIVQYYGSTQILVLAPPHAAGTVYVIATTVNGSSLPGPASQYTYGGGGGGVGGTFDFSQASYAVAENAGSVTITVNRSGLTSGAVYVSYLTSNGTAIAGFDYTAAAGTLNFASGQTTASFVVFIADDFIAETSETILLSLHTPSPGTTLGLQSTAIITITDNETGYGGSLQFSTASPSVNEASGPAVVNVTRTGSTSGVVTVLCSTSSGTAVQPADYTATSATLTWGNGVGGSQPCSIPIVNDATAEGNETVNLTLSSPSGGATLGSPSTAVLTIVDNDAPAAGVIYFSAPTYSVNENGVSATITVTRSGASASTASVNYATSNGTASSLSDYTAAAGTLSWGVAENSSKTFSVFITNDAIVEGDETVNLTLSGFVNAAQGTQSNAVLTIVDNDAAAPWVSSVTPSFGSLTGGEIITITGSNLAGAILVTFGGTSASIIGNTSTSVTVFAPYRGAPGTVYVQVTTPYGTSPVHSLSQYTYGSLLSVTSVSPNSGPAAGGTTVTITGTGFTGATNVYFGTTAAASFAVVNDTQITAVSPAHTAGTVDVTVVKGLDSSPNTSADNFTYLAAPAVTTRTYTLSFRWTIIVWEGADGASVTAALQGIESPDNPNTNNVFNIVTALFRWDATNQVWLAFFPSGVNIPGANDFTTFSKGVAYFVAVSSATNWTIIKN